MLTVNSTDGAQIAYERVGQGPPLVYVTGAICHRRFQPIVDDTKALANHYTVYTFDRRGRGDSGDGESYNPRAEVEDIRAIIDVAGGSAFIYGHSSGAVLALETALAYPYRVKKVLAYDVPYTANTEEQATFRETEDRVRALVAEGRNAEAIRHFLVAIGTPWLMAHLMRLVPGWGRTVQLAPTLLYDIELTKDPPPLERLAKLDVPALIAAGERSPENVRNVAKAIAESVRNARFEVVPNQDHMVDTKALLSIMNQFFNEGGA